jgi:hypothetical protein
MTDINDKSRAELEEMLSEVQAEAFWDAYTRHPGGAGSTRIGLQAAFPLAPALAEPVEIARPLLDALETQAAEIKRLIPMVKDALEKGRHRLLKEGFSPQDPTVRAMNDAIRALAQQEPTP